MVSKKNLSAFAHMTNMKFTCISVTSQNPILTKFIKFFCDNVLAISKSSFDVSFKVEIHLYLKDCLGYSCLIFGNSLPMAWLINIQIANVNSHNVIL